MSHSTDVYAPKVGDRWTGISDCPIRKIALASITELRLIAEQETGLRIWTDPPVQKDGVWIVRGTARRHE